MHLVLIMEWRLMGQLKNLRELIKTRRLDFKAGQLNKLYHKYTY
jgi:hypothetical protein